MKRNILLSAISVGWESGQPFSRGLAQEGGNDQANPLPLNQAQINDNFTTVSWVTTHQLNWGNCCEHAHEKMRGGRDLNETWAKSCTQTTTTASLLLLLPVLVNIQKSDHRHEILKISSTRCAKGNHGMDLTQGNVQNYALGQKSLSFASCWPGNSGSPRTDGDGLSIPGSVETNTTHYLNII